MKPNYETIEQYITGELTSEEILNFENQMNSNPEFKEEVDLYIEMNNSLQNKYTNIEKENNLIKTLEKQGEKYFNNTEINAPKKSIIKTIVFRTLPFAIVFIIGFFLMKPQTDLYTQFSEHQVLSVQVKGENTNLLTNAEKQFNQEKYSEAIPLLETYLRDNPNDPEIQMALGISLLEEEKVEDAMIIFSHIYGKMDVFKNKAAWYMALSYLKIEDFSQTKAFLVDIDNDSFYYDNAQKLLKKLK